MIAEILWVGLLRATFDALVMPACFDIVIMIMLVLGIVLAITSSSIFTSSNHTASEITLGGTVVTLITMALMFCPDVLFRTSSQDSMP